MDGEPTRTASGAPPAISALGACNAVSGPGIGGRAGVARSRYSVVRYSSGDTGGSMSCLAARRDGAPMLYGRGEQLAAVGRLLEGMRSGRAGALVLRGEAGIGKTALLDAAAEQAAGAWVLRVTGVEAEAELPFAALHALMRPALDEIGALPGRQAAALRGAFGLAEE